MSNASTFSGNLTTSFRNSSWDHIYTHGLTSSTKVLKKKKCKQYCRPASKFRNTCQINICLKHCIHFGPISMRESMLYFNSTDIRVSKSRKLGKLTLEEFAALLADFNSVVKNAHHSVWVPFLLTITPDGTGPESNWTMLWLSSLMWARKFYAVFTLVIQTGLWGSNMLGHGTCRLVWVHLNFHFEQSMVSVPFMRAVCNCLVGCSTLNKASWQLWYIVSKCSEGNCSGALKWKEVEKMFSMVLWQSGGPPGHLVYSTW